MNRIIALVIAGVLVLFAASSTLVVVDQRHMAVISAHGGEDPFAIGPGLHLKLPTPLQSATRVDMRVQTLEAGDADRLTTSDKTDLLVSPLVKYRIVDPLKLFEKTGGNVQSAPEQLATLASGALAKAFAARPLADALSHQADIAAAARASMVDSAGALGVELVDLQLERVDLTAGTADSVYKRMAAAREQAASETRAQGATEADAIKADAQRRRQAVLADAYKQAQSIKGQGDAQAAEIASQAFSRDPGFYQFFQSLQAYRTIFKPNDVIVVDSSSDFFRFMRSPDGNAGAAAGAPAPRKH